MNSSCQHCGETVTVSPTGHPNICLVCAAAWRCVICGEIKEDLAPYPKVTVCEDCAQGRELELAEAVGS